MIVSELGRRHRVRVPIAFVRKGKIWGRIRAKWQTTKSIGRGIEASRLGSMS
jgi:hypothetical protein